MEETFNFGQALKILKEGKKIARVGWNGKGMFAVFSPGHPDLEAEKFFSPILGEYAKTIGGKMTVRPSILLKTAQDDVAYWTPSGSDILAEDWVEVA